MILRRRGADVLVRAPAKVNLFLEVLRRRPDGYHELATLMTAVSLYDTLLFGDDPSGTVRLRCDRPDLSAGPDNLVCRAAELLRRRTGRDLGAVIRLWKRIPMPAGLGGGSSDAAAALAGLNALWRLGLSRAELAGLGAELGSDVPFFFAAPAAWCMGRGEKVEPFALGRPLDFVLVSPPVGLSTAEVFRERDAAGRSAARRGGSSGRGGRRRGGTGSMLAQPPGGAGRTALPCRGGIARTAGRPWTGGQLDDRQRQHGFRSMPLAGGSL